MSMGTRAGEPGGRSSIITTLWRRYCPAFIPAIIAVKCLWLLAVVWEQPMQPLFSCVGLICLEADWLCQGPMMPNISLMAG